LNSLLVLPEELISDTQALIRGARARYLLEYHDLKLGIEIKALLWGSGAGKAKITSIGADQVGLNLSLDQAPLPRPNVDLIVAVPRPQTLKKVLALSAMAGIGQLHFVKTARVEKSYLQSKSLQTENIRDELIKGMEQVCDSTAPEVFKEWSLSVLLEKLAQSSGPRLLLLADPNSKDNLTQYQSALSKQTGLTIFLGPEAGFENTEIELLLASGFKGINLGKRILRTEFALAYLLGQVQLLRP